MIGLATRGEGVQILFGLANKQRGVYGLQEAILLDLSRLSA